MFIMSNEGDMNVYHVQWILSVKNTNASSSARMIKYTILSFPKHIQVKSKNRVHYRVDVFWKCQIVIFLFVMLAFALVCWFAYAVNHNQLINDWLTLMGQEGL